MSEEKVNKLISEVTSDEAILFRKEKIHNYLIQIICDENINITGQKSDNLVGQLDNLLKSKDIPSDLANDIVTLCDDSSVEAADYAFFNGIVEGVRLFKLLMVM